MEQRKILMLVGDYGEDLEIYFAYQSLLMLGFQVHAGCPNRKPGDKIKTAVHDFRDGDQTYLETRGHDFELNVDLEGLDPTTYEGLVIPGGRAPEYLRLHHKVVDLVRHFVSHNKPIVAVCHGIQLLAAAGGIENRQLTCYPACRFEVTQSKGIYNDLKADEAIVDGNIVTSPAWPGHPAAFREFIKLLRVKITHE